MNVNANKKNIKKIIRRIIKGLNPFHNFWLKILSLFIALIALYFVAGQLVVEEMEVPLYLELPEELASIEPIQNKVIVRLLASSTIFNTLDKNQIYFDFKNLEMKPGEIFINLENYIKTPPGVEVGGIVPNKLKFSLEKQTTKEISVNVKFKGSPPRGYQLLRWELYPPMVILRGAESVLKSISTIETAEISLTNRTENFTLDTPLELENLNVETINNEPTVLTVHIISNAVSIKARNIPVEVISPPVQFQYNPKTITATFTCNGDKISAITDEDLKVYIDLSSDIRLKKEFRTTIKMDILNQAVRENCRFRYFSQKNVDVLISKLE